MLPPSKKGHLYDHREADQAIGGGPDSLVYKEEQFLRFVLAMAAGGPVPP